MKTKSESDIVKYVSTLLNDQYPGNAYVRWPRKLVQDAYREALSVIAMLRPDVATELVEVELVVGTLQRGPDGCSSVTKVVGLLDPATGAVMEQADKADNNLSKWFTDVCGPSDGTYSLSSYSLDDDNSSIFYVIPPVEPGQKATALVMCAGSCKSSRVDCRYETPIVEFMMYRLLSTEDDSVTSVQGASTHLNLFIQLLNLNKRLVDELVKDLPNAPTAPAN